MSQSPVLCQQCLGTSDHVRMIQQPLGEQCKLCTRPFTVFRWSLSGANRQSKKTIICYTCSKAKNCCQSCMVDIDYGIPLDIRDAALKMANIENPYGVDYASRNAETKAIMADKLEQRVASEKDITSEEKREAAKRILSTLASKLSGSSVPRTKKKEAEVSNKELSKVISKLPFGATLEIPEDPTTKSFFVFGFSSETPQYEVTAVFETFGPIASVSIMHQARCGFITFQKRSSAENFAVSLIGKEPNKSSKTAGVVILAGREAARVCWGSPRPLGNTKEEQHKIALVVSKVMRQLAERDAAGKGQKDKSKSGKYKKATSKDSGKSSADASARIYKSMDKDVEL